MLRSEQVSFYKFSIVSDSRRDIVVAPIIGYGSLSSSYGCYASYILVDCDEVQARYMINGHR